ncbi:IclR family transcriptional regulator [Brucella anthropi]|nr:IclR family transcriptional regulator [Brucella anthropi]
MTKENLSAVKSADRVIDLLEFLGRWGGGCTHAEISAALDIPKSSLSQLLRNLMQRGFVAYVSETKTYGLGERLYVLVNRTKQVRDLRALAGGLLEQLTAEIGESSALNILKGNIAEVVASVSSRQRLVSHMHVGDLAPLYAISGGKAILANLPEEQRNAYLDQVSFEVFTPNTIQSVDRLHAELDAVRASGFAYSIEEYTVGIIGIGRVVKMADGQVAGSLNIAIPSARFTDSAKASAQAALVNAVSILERQLVD